MKFTLRTPCDQCPFRTDRRPFITIGKVLMIRDSLVYNDQTFPCHKTLEPGKEIHCAGALILMEHTKLTFNNYLLRLAALLKIWKPQELDLTAPVYKTWGAMMKAHHDAQA